MSDQPHEPLPVVLLVEGWRDRLIVTRLLALAGYTSGTWHVEVGGAKYGLARRVRELVAAAPAPNGPRYAILADLDEASVEDARTRIREQLDHPPAEVFCAVPMLEAWLFADDRAVREYAKHDDEILRVVERLPLPEEIPDPKQLARFVFGSTHNWIAFVDTIDIGRACARSPSLRSFIEGMGELLQQPSVPPIFDRVARHMTRDIISGLLREVSPANAVVWRTAGGEAYTAAELGRHIESGDDLGNQYASDLLRIARDLLRRSANRT
jgi:hypothetical protein